jgi:hypothetical protein
MTLTLEMYHKRKRGARPLLKLSFEGLVRGEHAKWIAPAEAVTLTALVTDIARIKVTVHGILQGHTFKVLQTVRHISGQEPSVG